MTKQQFIDALGKKSPNDLRSEAQARATELLNEHAVELGESYGLPCVIYDEVVRCMQLAARCDPMWQCRPYPVRVVFHRKPVVLLKGVSDGGENVAMCGL